MQKFDIQALIGNAGGYIGLFIGYALIGIPEVLKTLTNQIKSLFKRESSVKIMVQNSRNDTETRANSYAPYDTTNDVRKLAEAMNEQKQVIVSLKHEISVMKKMICQMKGT